jgi:hypothetical protein
MVISFKPPFWVCRETDVHIGEFPFAGPNSGPDVIERLLLGPLAPLVTLRVLKHLSVRTLLVCLRWTTYCFRVNHDLVSY